MRNAAEDAYLTTRKTAQAQFEELTKNHNRTVRSNRNQATHTVRRDQLRRTDKRLNVPTGPITTDAACVGALYKHRCARLGSAVAVLKNEFTLCSARVLTSLDSTRTMSWLQTHEVAVPFYEVRAGKQVFAIQLHERALRQEELARNWSSITSTSSQFLLENDDDDENHSMAGNTSGVRVTAKRSYSQFRKLWRDLIRATKTPATAMLLRSNSAETTHSGHASNRSLANTFHSVPSSGGESSSCRCRNWNCTFRSFHHFLRSYPFPSKFLIKRNTPAVLENRRRGLELFITTVRGLFDTFPRPFLQSIDSLANCQVLMTLNIFFGFEEKYQLASRTTLRLPTVPKPTSTSRSSSSGSVASDSTTSFSSSSRSVTSSSSTWNIDKERRVRSPSAEERSLYGSGVEYYLRKNDSNLSNHQNDDSVFELHELQDLPAFLGNPNDRKGYHTVKKQTSAKYMTPPTPASSSSKNSTKLQLTGRRSRYYRGIDIRRHTAFLARNPTMTTRSRSSTSHTKAPQTLLPGLPKLHLPSNDVSSMRSFLEEFRDHLLLDSRALGSSTGPLEGWNEDRQWELALYVASQIGHAYAVESILYRGTNPNAVMEDGLTSLHAACRCGHQSIVALLLTHGADTNVTDSSGVSPLLSAVQRGDLEVVEMLVEYGANVNLCNTDNVSAVHVAVACQALPVLQLLLEFDAFVNTKNTYNGKTPLHLAAQSGSLPMCKLLLSHGGSIHHKTTRGLDVVALARSHGHDSVARLCLNFGNDQKMAQRESSKMSQTAAGASTSENLHDEVRIVSEDGYAYAVFATAPINNSECWDSVSYLESAFHHGFMRLRLKTGDFVYHEDPRLTRELDEFCDVDSMHTPKGPVILLGESGMGKSAFLANWVVRRKKMFQNWQSSYPEFIFAHVVGCSRQSCSVSNLLERILREIKEYFELTKEIPDVEERLSWQFPRFLESASKKGRVIIVVDGLHRLHTNNGESILKWVPLSFPPNVRIIFSGTLNYPTAKLSHVLVNYNGPGSPAHTVPRGDEGEHNECGVGGDYYEKTSLSAQMIERIKVEAGRRNWKLIHVLPLVEEDRRRIVQQFITKNSDSDQDDDGSPRKTGLQLFEIQQNAIVGVAMSASPHFLKNFLVGMLWAVKEGFNIHTVFESWLAAETVGQLLESILRSMEAGYTPDQLSTDDAMQFLLDRTRIEIARAAAEAAVRESNDSLRPLAFRPREDDGRASPSGTNEMKRMKSVHETKELFVNMARADGSRVQSTVDSGPASQSHESFSSTKNSSAVSSMLEAAHHKLKRFPTEPRGRKQGALNKLGNRPDYLTGGRTVAPLGELLGRALCLLYVSRHGLLLNELRFILNAIVTESRGIHRHRDNRDDEGTAFDHPAGKSSMGQQLLTAFSEDEWQALLRALRTLSVLFVQEVVVLPLCKDILRDVIWWRYIGSERDEQQYHQWLIRFFRIHPTTFRRVEELPWHLKRCYQWDALRQVLVNLPMFQLLYTANYKAELYGYWKVLTDGPLLNYGAAKRSSDPPVYVMPFDIVKEYGKSITDWYHSARPSTKNFTAIVQLITRFMYEFCVSYQRPLPQFVHAPFDLKRLYLDGFLFVENLPHAQTVGNSAVGTASVAALSSVSTTGSSTLGGISSMESTLSTASSALLTALDNFPPTANASTITTLSSTIKDKEAFRNCFFFYQRWVWIQFPWLALGREIVVRDQVVQNPILEKATVISVGNKNSAPGSVPTIPHAPSSNSLLPLGSSRGRPGDGSDEEVRRHNAGDAKTAMTATLSQARSGLFDARFWDVKKSMFDPTTRRPRGAMTTSQLAAVKNASVLMTSVSTSLVNQTVDMISPEHLFRKKTAYTTVKGVLTSSLRRLPTAALKSSSSLPSLQEQRTFVQNSTFPVGNRRESTKKTDLSSNDPMSADRSTAQSPTNAALMKPGLPSKELKLDSIASTEDLVTVATSFGLPAHFQDYPQSDWDLKQSYNHRVVLKLQNLYDTVKTEVAQKQKYLQDVKRKIRETTRRYELTMRECDMAKHAAAEMSSRLAKLEQVTKNIDHQEKTHRKLIRGCELFPACAPAHFEANKKELRLLQMKLKDLQAEKKVLLMKKAHLQNEELPVVRKAVEKSKHLLSAVVEKLERSREKVAHDQASSEKLYQRRLEMIESVRTASGKESNSTIEEEARKQARQTFSATTRSLAAKVALQQCESMCEKIQKATGFSKMELILQKFTRREELNASFEEQAKLYEARLKQIKLNQAELEEQLHSLETSQATASTEDPRLLEQKLRAAEVELARAEYTQASLLTSSKEVIAGAARIVKLMGITNCSDPYQNAIPAARLWPPPVGYEGENSLTSEFETLEPPAIAAMLQLCQDRATLMIDAIEGARSDPDINFSLVRQVSPLLQARAGTREFDRPGLLCADCRLAVSDPTAGDARRGREGGDALESLPPDAAAQQRGGEGQGQGQGPRGLRPRRRAASGCCHQRRAGHAVVVAAAHQQRAGAGGGRGGAGGDDARAVKRELPVVKPAVTGTTAAMRRKAELATAASVAHKKQKTENIKPEPVVKAAAPTQVSVHQQIQQQQARHHLHSASNPLGASAAAAAAAAAAAREKVMKEPQSGDLYECVITKRNGGLGLTLACVDDHVQITGLAPDTPAANSGICVGDTLVAVSGLPVRGLQFSTVIGRLKSTSRNSVVLKLRRNPFRQNAGNSASYRGIKRPGRGVIKGSDSSNSANVLSSKTMALETRLGGGLGNGLNGSAGTLGGATNSLHNGNTSAGLDDLHRSHHQGVTGFANHASGLHAQHLQMQLKSEPMNSTYFPTDASVLTMGASVPGSSTTGAVPPSVLAPTSTVPSDAQAGTRVTIDEKDRYYAECRALRHELGRAMVAQRTQKRDTEAYTAKLQTVVDKFQEDVRSLLPPKSIAASESATSETAAGAASSTATSTDELASLRQKLLEANQALAKQQTEMLALQEREARHALPEAQRVKWQLVSHMRKSVLQVDCKTASKLAATPAVKKVCASSGSSLSFEERLDGVRPSSFALLVGQSSVKPDSPTVEVDLDTKASTELLGWNMREVVVQAGGTYTVSVADAVHVKYMRTEESLVVSWTLSVKDNSSNKK
ncbi:hypothetical protein ON010_g4130 [Phytophthora cinnamomi]|nr:hypothetical protein ON010_g4130 [Phytophthora cinnamomi]